MSVPVSVSVSASVVVSVLVLSKSFLDEVARERRRITHTHITQQVLSTRFHARQSNNLQYPHARLSNNPRTAMLPYPDAHSASSSQVMGIMDMLGEGFAGTTKGSFFEAPSWVNKDMAAGRTNQVGILQHSHPIHRTSLQSFIICLFKNSSFFLTSKIYCNLA